MGLERREGLGGDEIKVRDCRKGQASGALSQCRKSCWENQERKREEKEKRGMGGE